MGLRTRALAGAIAVAACALAATTSAWAAPGDLDTSFGIGAGFVNLNFSALVAGATHSGDYGYDVAIQPDGRIFVVGITDAVNAYDMAVLRLTTAGAIDTSYGLGTGGSRINYAALVPGATKTNDRATAVALQPDGKIVLGGWSDAAGTNDMAIVRLNNPEGTPDTSYGLNGASRINLGGDDTATDVAVQRDGRILVNGSLTIPTATDTAAARVVAPQGTGDPSFAGSGGFRFNFAGLVPGATSEFDVSSRMALQPDGKIVLAGYTDAAGGKYDMTVLRLTQGGTIDTSYGLGTGGSRIDIGTYINGATASSYDAATDIGIQSDGKIVLAGLSLARGDFDFAVARVRSPQGTMDPTFGPDGKGAALVNLGGEDRATSMAIQANGKILVAGYTGPAAANDPAIVRFQPNGTLDTTFGDGGKEVLQIPGNQTVTSMALAPNGKIVLAGTTGADDGADMFVAQLQGDSPSQGGGPGGSGGGGKTAKVPRCDGKRATVLGTNKRNRLKGTKRADVIVSLGGNDTIDGKGGSDVICSGDGNDKVKGGDGNDRILAGNGNDTVSGGNGKDRVSGQNGKDKLAGGAGNDKLDGGSGNDKLSGQGGVDTLLGRGGTDKLIGGPGKDKQKQ